MTRWERVGVAAALGLALSGCGQKGQLYLPDDVGEVVTRPISTTGAAPAPAPAGTTGDAAAPPAPSPPADAAATRKPTSDRAPSPAGP